jgi:hypothetical protein
MERAIILGDSPFLKEVEHILHYVLDKNYVLGINYVITKCRADVHVFTDANLIPLTNSYPNIDTISMCAYGAMIRKPKKTLINTFTYIGDYCIKKDGKFAWCGFTHDYVISYLISKGCKEIILLGAADFINGNHYTHDWRFKRSDALQEKSIGFIEDCANMYADIKTCNPNSPIKIPHIPIEELL